MKGKADKFDLRLRMVKHALVYGVKPTARVFDTRPKTVRKWLRRYQQEGLAGLNELPRIPLTCPHKTSPAIERKVVNLRKHYPFMGAKRLKREHNLPCSHEAIRRILNEHGLIKNRRKKHKRKKDLSKIKKKWKLFGQFTIDTKDLKDIPHYWPQMKALSLPKYQFTAREVRSGLMFLGFSNEKSAASACLFGRLLCEHLRNSGLDLNRTKFQTDNGSEFIGCFRQDRTRDGFERIVEGFGAKHKRIPPRAFRAGWCIRARSAAALPEGNGRICWLNWPKHQSCKSRWIVLPGLYADCPAGGAEFATSGSWGIPRL